MVVKIGAVDTLGRTLLRLGPSTAADLAVELGLTGAAVRKSLDSLIDSGWVVASQKAPYGPAALDSRRGRGRPARIFTLSAAGRARFGAHEDSLAVAAVRHLTHVAGHSEVVALAEKIARDFARRHGQVGDGATVQQRAAALVDALNDDGFAAVASPGPADSTQICQHHCPMGDLAVEFPVFCDAEAEVFSELTGVHVTRLATIAGGNHVCTTLVPNSRREDA